MRKPYLAALLLLAAGCGAKSKDDQRTQRPDGGGFSLTASKYCGDVTPEVPENPVPPHRFAKDFLDAKLSGDGLTGWIHGAVPMYKQYVFTYRKEDPNDFMAFFKAEQFSLVPASAEVAATLATLKRHDQVKLKGRVFENGSPMTHLTIDAVEMLKKYEGATENTYTFDPSVLQGRKSFDVFGIVHATAASEELGRAIVVEYGDVMLPLAVPAVHDAAAAPLYRGDIVKVAVRVVDRPHGPPHLEVDPDVEQAIEVVDPMINCHGLERTVTGYLAKFEKSPAISTDVYAVRVVDANGIGRNYTLFPDTGEDDAAFMEVFKGLSGKAKAAWDEAAEAPQVVRNFWKKESVKVTVKGRLNVVSTEQANAQVYVKSVDDLTLAIEPAPAQ